MIDATQMFIAMDSAISLHQHKRTVGDTTSPQQNETIEAEFGRLFVMHSPCDNVVTCKSIDLRWAVANVLHFFAATEEGSVLKRYNKNAYRFLVDDRLRGAYGAIAVPQLQRCIELLNRDPHTRRAVVSMGELSDTDRNRPACWSQMHFLRNMHGELDMFVYQRSLNLFGVMPYDCILLTNIQTYVARAADMRIGSLRWAIGSLHRLPTDRLQLMHKPRSVRSCILPMLTLLDSAQCYKILHEPGCWDASPQNSWLAADEEVRT